MKTRVDFKPFELFAPKHIQKMSSSRSKSKGQLSGSGSSSPYNSVGSRSSKRDLQNSAVHFHYHVDEENLRDSRDGSSRSRSPVRKSVEVEDDDDMEVMSVNYQRESLKKSSIGSESRSSSKRGQPINTKQSNESLKSTSSTQSSLSSKVSELAISYDTIPLKMKKKSPEVSMKESRDFSEKSEHENQDEDMMSSKDSSSLHILSSVRKKMSKQPEPTLTSKQPSKMADYINRFRTAPPTKRSERKRLDVIQEEVEELVKPKKELDTNWLKQTLYESNEDLHPSVQKIKEMRDSIRRETEEVDEDIRHVRSNLKRYESEDFSEIDFSLPPQTVSLKDRLSMIDTIDIDIKELNDYTDLALENGSFHLYENFGSYKKEQKSEKKDKPESSFHSSAHSLISSSDSEDLDRLVEENIKSRLRDLGLQLELSIDLDQFQETKAEQLANKSISEEKDKSINDLSKKSIIVDEEKQPSISSQEQDPFPVVTIKTENPKDVSVLSSYEEPVKIQFAEEEMFERMEEENGQQSNKEPIILPQRDLTQSIDSVLGKSLQSVSSLSSTNEHDISFGFSQRMIAEMVTESPTQTLTQPTASVKIDDDNELFTSDFVCQALRTKIDGLKQRLQELEKIRDDS